MDLTRVLSRVAELRRFAVGGDTPEPIARRLWAAFVATHLLAIAMTVALAFRQYWLIVALFVLLVLAVAVVFSLRRRAGLPPRPTREPGRLLWYVLLLRVGMAIALYLYFEVIFSTPALGVLGAVAVLARGIWLLRRELPLRVSG